MPSNVAQQLKLSDRGSFYNQSQWIDESEEPVLGLTVTDPPAASAVNSKKIMQFSYFIQFSTGVILL